MNATGKPKVLLVGWDAADWEHISPLLDQGLLPTLNGLVNEGVMGNLGTLQPILSPMLWNSIATGKQPHKHGIHGFIEPDTEHGGARPSSSASRKCKALWNILSQSGLKSNVINWWASHPAEPINGCIVTNMISAVSVQPGGRLKMPRGAVHPDRLSAQIAECKVFPEELTGEQLLPFVPRGNEVNQDEDPRLSYLATNVADMLTTHAAATAVMESEPWDFMAVYYTAIDHFAHAFMPYHPPRLPWISEADFEMYKDVMLGAYRFSDMTLRRLLELAGHDTTVILCSDHGFQSRELRPARVPNEPAGPAYWHRRYGIVVVKGPNIKKDERVHGASLLDIAPTILTLFGLPLGEDMDGRPLLEIFESPPEIKTIPSWETVEGESGMHTGKVGFGDPEAASQLMDQLVALGYVEAPGATKQEQAETADIESKYDLAKNLAWCGKLDDAIELLAEQVRRAPWESRFITLLARYCVAGGNRFMAERILQSAFNLETTTNAGAKLMWADILLGKGDAAGALQLLQKIEAGHRLGPEGLNQIGLLYLRLRRLADAERVFSRAIQIHPENAEAYESLSTVYLRQGRNQQAADAALSAVRFVHQLPSAHLNLGIALARSGNHADAMIAFQTALRFNPNIPKAHRWLSIIYRKMPGQTAKAEQHLAECKRILAARAQRRREQTIPRTVLFDLPDLTTEKERDRLLNEKRPPPRNPGRKSGKCFTLVSGLPRSGTSVMMQMLEAGGLPPKTDGERKADVDNPKGYYEWEAIKSIQSKPQLMDEEGLDHKAIKVISMLLPHMPYQHEYRVIFMNRPVEEVVESQAAMIERLGTKGAKLSSEQLQFGLAEHRDQVLAWLRKHPRAKVLEVDYPTLMRAPETYIDPIAEFVGAGLLPNAQAMRSVIDPSLYRKRKSDAQKSPP